MNTFIATNVPSHILVYPLQSSSLTIQLTLPKNDRGPPPVRKPSNFGRLSGFKPVSSVADPDPDPIGVVFRNFVLPDPYSKYGSESGSTL